MISFNSWEYIFFLIFVVGLYWRLTKKQQNVFLLAASLVFYGSWDWRFLFLLLFSTSIDFWAARIISSSADPKRRKFFLYLSIASNLVILGFFKYNGFFLENVNGLLERAGYSAYIPIVKIILPIGISFYTLQAIGYVVDVYRKVIEPIPSLLLYMLFICFFPQLVAGPIERAKHMLPQFQTKRVFSRRQFMDGIDLILWGLVKKMVVADNIAHYVSIVFDLKSPPLLLIMVATFGFGIQILADFSGYTDIARGSAKLLGFELTQNFNSPYLARNPVDFWRRWHISLSNFVRDYIYIPLGGSHVTTTRYLFNILITWSLMGFWHGAEWHYIVWGLFHGTLIMFYQLFIKNNKLIARMDSRIVTVLAVSITYVTINSGLLLFRIDRLAQLGNYFSRNALIPSVNDARLAFLLTVLFVIFSFPLMLGLYWRWARRVSPVSDSYFGSLRIIYYTLSLLGLLIFANMAYDFIYFQF